MAARRRGAHMAAAAAFLALASSPAAADADRYAAIVVDVRTREILHADQADEDRYPASLTKMMTLYLLFEAMERENRARRNLSAWEQGMMYRRALEGARVVRATAALRGLLQLLPAGWGAMTSRFASSATGPRRRACSTSR